MKSLKSILVASLFATVAGSAMADGAVVHDGYEFDKNKLIPTGVRAEVGTTGYGGALLWTANPYVGLALGYNGGDISWDNHLKIDGDKYDMDTDNSNAYLNAEIHPWGASDNRWVQAIYLAAGVAFMDNDYDLKRKINGDREFSANHEKFTSDLDGVEIKGKMKYKNDFAPYLGVGYAPKFGNWGLFAEAGAYYTGNPEVNLDARGQVQGGRQAEFEQAVRDEAHKIENKSKYEWLPVGKVGVSFYW